METIDKLLKINEKYDFAVKWTKFNDQRKKLGANKTNELILAFVVTINDEILRVKKKLKPLEHLN